MLMVECSQAKTDERYYILEQRHRAEEEVKWLQTFVVNYFDYVRAKDPPNSKCIERTCEWFLSHQKYQDWRGGKASSLLWVTADLRMWQVSLVKISDR